MIALSLGLTLALGAQDPKKDAPKPADTKPAESKPADAKPADAKPAEKKDATTADPNTKPAPAPVVDEAPKPIPPEVEAKLEAARRALAEAIVAAQDAGLVDTSIEPPPILDILVTGRATDKKALKDHKGVSPEVFGAWFTGYAPPLEGITAQGDVRIVQPSQGLKDLYDARAGVLSRHIDAIRKAKAAAAPKPAETKAEAKPAESKPEAKPAETKPAESKPAAKPAETPKSEAKPAEKKDEKK
jgi:hypothetical protein